MASNDKVSVGRPAADGTVALTKEEAELINADIAARERWRLSLEAENAKLAEALERAVTLAEANNPSSARRQ
jgi:hypothetical protein